MLSVDSADCLNQQMLLQRLVVVHIGKRRYIKTSDPHIDNDGNAEVGIVLFECCIQFLGPFSVLNATQIIVHLRFVILTYTRNHSHKRHRTQFTQLFLGKPNTIRCFLFYKPFRILSLELFQQSKSNLSVGTYNHRFLHFVRIVGTSGYIVVMDISCQAFQAGWLAQNDFHRTHRLLAGFDIFFCSTVIRTLLIVIFDLLDLFLIQQNLCNTRMVLDGYSQTVCNSLIHGIPVDFSTKGLIGFFNRRSRKTDKGSVRKCFLQYLRIGLGYHCTHILVSILAELNLFCIFNLCSVCLVGKANNVSAAIDKTDFIVLTVAELLNGTDIETAAFTRTKFLAELFTGRNDTYLAELQKFLTLGK